MPHQDDILIFGKDYTVEKQGDISENIFSPLSRRVLDAQKFDTREKKDHYRSNRSNCYMCENKSAPKNNTWG